MSLESFSRTLRARSASMSSSHHDAIRLCDSVPDFLFPSPHLIIVMLSCHIMSYCVMFKENPERA